MTYTRSAIFEGTIHPGCEDAFFQIVMNDLMAVWKRMPNAQAVRVLRPYRAEPGGPAVIAVQEIDYPSLAAVEEAERSPVRQEGAPIMERLGTLFDGRFRHVVYERLA